MRSRLSGLSIHLSGMRSRLSGLLIRLSGIGGCALFYIVPRSVHVSWVRGLRKLVGKESLGKTGNRPSIPYFDPRSKVLPSFDPREAHNTAEEVLSM
eukprot:4269330-Pyramimonas_sp.AAC.1